MMTEVVQTKKNLNKINQVDKIETMVKMINPVVIIKQELELKALKGK